MRRLLLLMPFLIPFISFGQFTATQLHTGIRVNIKNQSASQLRLANMLDSIVHSMSSSSQIPGLILTPTTVKTSTYTAGVGQLVLTDATAGNVPITIPSGVADKSAIAIKMILGSTLGTTVTLAGGATINRTGGVTTFTQIVQGQYTLLQYNSTSNIWYIVGEGVSITQLDSRYQGVSGTRLTLTGVSPTYAQGSIIYDTDNQSFTVYNNDANVAMNLGQETWTMVRNVTGSTIANGAAVYILPAIGTNLPTIGLAQSNAIGTTVVDGLATESIANNAIGYVAIDGVVRGLNTNSFTAGQQLYLDATTAGALTNTAPTSPNFTFPIGIVKVVGTSTGEVQLIRPRRNIQNIGNNTIAVTTTGATSIQLPTLGTLYGTATGSITSAQLATSLTDETGTGVNVMATTPTLVTPVLGVATATSINKVAITAPTTSATLTLITGSTLATAGAFSNTLTTTATTNATFPAGTITLADLTTAQNVTNKTLDKLRLTTGANTSVGTATLVAGTVTVNTTAALTASVILLTSQSDSGTPGFVRVTARVNATSFTITSSSGSDTSVIGYIIIN